MMKIDDFLEISSKSEFIFINEKTVYFIIGEQILTYPIDDIKNCLKNQQFTYSNLILNNFSFENKIIINNDIIFFDFYDSIIRFQFSNLEFSKNDDFIKIDSNLYRNKLTCDFFILDDLMFPILKDLKYIFLNNILRIN